MASNDPLLSTNLPPTQPQMTYQRQDPTQQEQPKKDKKDKKDKKKKKEERRDDDGGGLQMCADCINLWSSCFETCIRTLACRSHRGHNSNNGDSGCCDCDCNCSGGCCDC
ncbi:hypothetical protein TWF481_010210 [Arthrobotrys musiformis]|uniref:Uncharacterized protein n=1 Tax=Arthrobotrys musiformis TaxID=47236 RepID=A0AAV9W2G8_9PEZI